MKTKKTFRKTKGSNIFAEMHQLCEQRTQCLFYDGMPREVGSSIKTCE
jgi:hypothetical protein